MFFILLISISWGYSIKQFLNLTPYQIQGLSMETLQECFKSGQIGGYIGSQELSDLIDKLADSFPKYVTRQSYGNTYKGQKIKTIKISATKQQKYQIAIIGMLQGTSDMISVNYLIYELYYIAIQLSNKQYFMTTLLNDKTLFITPAINLDGLQFINTYYNQNTQIPIILKNRNILNQNLCSILEIGVNLQRNFQYKFGMNEIGSSSIQCNQQYRGQHEFSENETLAIDKQISQINPNIIMILGGDQNNLIIPDNSSQIYLELLWKISQNYRFNMNDYESIYGTQINGDLCQNYIYSMNKICFTMNIGSYFVDKYLDNYKYLFTDFLQYYSASLSITLFKEFDCSNGKMICKVLESNEKGYVTILEVKNEGYNTFNDNIMIDIILNQGGEKLYQIDSYQITMNPLNQDDTKLQKSISIDEISTEIVYRYNLQYNKRLNQNQTIYFMFLITQYGFSYNYINTVSSINLTYSLQNTLLNTFVFQTLQPNQLKAKKSNQELQQLFPNRAESYVLLICFAGATILFFLAWIIRKCYLIIYNPIRMVEETLSRSAGSSDEKNLEHYHPQIESRLNTQVKFSQIAPFQSIRANDSPPLSKQSSNVGITLPDELQNNKKQLPHISVNEIENRVHRALEIVQQNEEFNQDNIEQQKNNNFKQNSDQLLNTPNIQNNNNEIVD